MAAFRAPATRGFDGALAREFPNVTVVDVSASIGQIQRVLDQVIRAVEFLFGFTLAAGLVVLFAALAATREARAREFAVMRALGASGRLLARVQRAELLGVGALAGVLASCAAIAIGWALARWVFEFEWHARPWIPLAGGAAGAAAGAGRRLVGAARGARPAGDRDAAQRGRLIGRRGRIGSGPPSATGRRPRTRRGRPSPGDAAAGGMTDGSFCVSARRASVRRLVTRRCRPSARRGRRRGGPTPA